MVIFPRVGYASKVNKHLLPLARAVETDPLSRRHGGGNKRNRTRKCDYYLMVI